MDMFSKVDDVAKAISVTPSTVKKYYALFEQEGYRFKRSNEGHVLFSEHDIDLLKDLIVLKNQPQMTVLKAVKQLVQNEVITDTTDMTTDMTVMARQVTTVMSDMAEMKEMLIQQQEVNKQLMEQLQQQQEYIKSSMGQRDKALVTSLKESMESQKQLAATVQEELEKERQKSFWQKLFGGK